MKRNRRNKLLPGSLLRLLCYRSGSDKSDSDDDEDTRMTSADADSGSVMIAGKQNFIC